LKIAEERACLNPETAARRNHGVAKTNKPARAISISRKINYPTLFKDVATPAKIGMAR
jgi:hypothetical protein